LRGTFDQICMFAITEHRRFSWIDYVIPMIGLQKWQHSSLPLKDFKLRGVYIQI
jgi:hypothetical protein